MKGVLGLRVSDRWASVARIEGLLRREAVQALTYRNVGMVKDGPEKGFRFAKHSTFLGRGDEIFDAAVQALRSWDVHRRAGLEVHSDSAFVRPGSTVILVARLPILLITMACRVVEKVEEEDRWGFVYGTLPLHVERGEQSFIVRKNSQGDVEFEISSLSRLGHPLALLAAPIARTLQDKAHRKYIESMRFLVCEQPLTGKSACHSRGDHVR